jgi:hypothetical protein
MNMHVQPDTETGDIVFVLQLKDHPKFKRKGDDLFVQHSLTLTEALCGFQFPLTHLDGRQLLIKCIPGEIIKPGLLPLFLYLVWKLRHGWNFVARQSCQTTKGVASNFFSLLCANRSMQGYQ